MAKTKKIQVNRLPLTKARVHLGEVIRLAHRDKQYFILEKDGIPVAGIMDIGEFEDYLETRYEQQDPEFQAQIAEGTRAYQAGKAKPAANLFKELENR